MNVTEQTVRDDLDNLDVWYHNEIAENKRTLLNPANEQYKLKNKAARKQYLSQRNRLRLLLETVANQPITVSDPPEPKE